MIYVVFWNVISFCMMGIDKWKAMHKRYRIPERFLLLYGFLGGAFGIGLGMIVFRHKIRNAKFSIMIPFFCILQVIAIGLVLFD